MKNKEEQIKLFWEDQARQFKSSPLATAPDQYYRELEIASIAKYLQNGASILDVGCGNGYSTLKFARQFPRCRFTGVDYSSKMVRYAAAALKRLAPSFRGRVRFIEGDVRQLSGVSGLAGKKFDFIVSERCLINLKNWKEQRESLWELKKLLKPKGRIVLCENTQEGLARLNSLRKIFKLPSIKTRWHNYYMPERVLLPFLKKEFQFLESKNIGSLYYVISRVVYAKYSQLLGKEPDYRHPLNRIAAELPYLGEYSPNYIFLLQNKS